MILVKIGGGAAINLDGIVEDLAGLDRPFVVVHGANAARDELAAALGWEKKMLTSVSGHTSVFSDERLIDLQMMAYAGLRNQRIVERFQQRGVNAVGLSGLDGRLVQGRRNRGIRVREAGKLRIIHDFSGKPQAVNCELLTLLLDRGYTPVLSVPIVDEEGCAINSENDDIVAVLQQALGAKAVLQLIEAPGFLESRDDPSSLVPQIPRADLERREQLVEGRMKRKLHAIRKLLDSGAARVIIADGRVEHPVRDALAGRGTLIH